MFKDSNIFARFQDVMAGLNPQDGAMVKAVRDALVSGYIESRAPMVQAALHPDVKSLEGYLRQFVFAGTTMENRLRSAGRVEMWEATAYRSLTQLFKTGLAGQDVSPCVLSGRRVVRVRPASCLSRVCGCVTWTINLCVIAGILGLLGFIAMDERRTTVQFWIELVRPPVPVSPVEERLKAMVQETLMQTQMTLEHSNNEKIAEVTQGVGPEVQSLQKMLEEMKPRVQSVQNSLTMTETHLNTLSEEASVMQNEIDRQAKVINKSQAVLADLIPSLNATKAEVVAVNAECEMVKSNLRYVKFISESQMNTTMDRIDDFEYTMRQLMEKKAKEVLTNVSRLVNKTEKETKKRVADLEASTTKKMNAIEYRLAGVSHMASQILDSTNNALFLPDGGWLLNGYISLTFKSVGLTGLLFFIQWPLVLFKARVNKKTQMHQRLTVLVKTTIWYTDLLLCNLFMCVCVVVSYKTYTMCAAVKNDYTVRCVAYVCGCIMSGLNAVFGN